MGAGTKHALSPASQGPATLCTGKRNPGAKPPRPPSGPGRRYRQPRKPFSRDYQDKAQWSQKVKPSPSGGQRIRWPPLETACGRTVALLACPPCGPEGVFDGACGAGGHPGKKYIFALWNSGGLRGCEKLEFVKKGARRTEQFFSYPTYSILQSPPPLSTSGRGAATRPAVRDANHASRHESPEPAAAANPLPPQGPQTWLNLAIRCRRAAPRRRMQKEISRPRRDVATAPGRRQRPARRDGFPIRPRRRLVKSVV